MIMDYDAEREKHIPEYILKEGKTLRDSIKKGYKDDHEQYALCMAAASFDSTIRSANVEGYIDDNDELYLREYYLYPEDI